MKFPFVPGLIGLIAIQSAAAVEYKADWNYENFYNEVGLCQAAVVIPGLRDYEMGSLRAGRDPKQLRSDLISMSPQFSYAATSVCYCAVNEAAKAITHESYAKSREAIGTYRDLPVCQKKLNDASTVLNDPAKADALNLK